MSNDSQMYIAVIVSESTVDNPDVNLYYQECFTLIKASSLEEAKEKAVNHATNTINTSYLNLYNESVTWVVKEISTVTNILEDNLDLHTEAVDLYVRGFEDYKAYQSLFNF